MHTALQGSFGLVLQGTDGAQLLIPEQEQQYRKRVERERASGTPEVPTYTTAKGKPKDEMVDWFLYLFSKTQEAHRMSYMAGVPLQPTGDQIESVEWIHWSRGHLIHFGRTGLSLDVRNLLSHLVNGLDIVETLLTRTQYMSREVWGGPRDTMVDYKQAIQARELIASIRTELVAVRDRYGLPTPETT